MARFSNEESIVLAEILQAGTCTWEVYKKKCGAHGLSSSRLLVCGMLRLTEAHIEGEEDVRDDSIVALTERGETLAKRVKQVRDIFCDPSVDLASPRRRHSRGHIRQRELFPSTN